MKAWLAKRLFEWKIDKLRRRGWEVMQFSCGCAYKYRLGNPFGIAQVTGLQLCGEKHDDDTASADAAA